MTIKDIFNILKLKVGWTWTLPTFSKKNEKGEIMSDTIITTAENWLVRICLKRGVTGGVLALGAYFGTHEIGKILPQLGVTVDWNAAAAGALTLVVGGLHMLHDYLKVKKGITWL